MIESNLVKRIWIKVLLSIITLNMIFLQSFPFISANSADLFPKRMNEVITANYTNHQTMLHWDDGKFIGNGQYFLNYTSPIEGKLEILGQYDVHFWHRACDAPDDYNGTTLISVNQTNRFIIENNKRIGSASLANQYTNLFLGETLQGNFSKLFLLEELFYITDVIHCEPFDFAGYSYINFQNEAINTTKMQWVGQLLYAGSICGMGVGPVFNCSFEYFYDTISGILVYSRVKIHQYLPDNPAIYQIHDFTNELTELHFTGQKDPDDSNSNESIFSDPIANNSAFWPIISIFGIIFIGFFTIFLIRKKNLQDQARKTKETKEKHLAKSNILTTTNESKTDTTDNLPSFNLF